MVSTWSARKRKISRAFFVRPGNPERLRREGRWLRRLVAGPLVWMSRDCAKLHQAKASVSGGAGEFRRDRALQLKQSYRAAHPGLEILSRDRALQSCGHCPRLPVAAVPYTSSHKNHHRTDTDQVPSTQLLSPRVLLHIRVREVGSTRW